jgi:hypothetical protein
MFDGGARDYPPGVQPYPKDLENEVARLAIDLATGPR